MGTRAHAKRIEKIEHIEKFGDGHAVLNDFGLLDSELHKLNEIKKIFREKSILVHPDKAAADIKKRADELYKIILAARDSASNYTNRRGSMEGTDPGEMFIRRGFTVLLNINEQKEHIEVLLREGVDRKYAMFEKRVDDQGTDTFDFEMYREDMASHKNRDHWTLFDSEE